MDMTEYQGLAAETAVYQDKLYPITSLIVEAAELADLFIKPYLRGDNDGEAPDRDEIIGEAGDVLWNLANMLLDAGITLNEVAEYNLKKLRSRQARGVIQGNGGQR